MNIESLSKDTRVIELVTTFYRKINNAELALVISRVTGEAILPSDVAKLATQLIPRDLPPGKVSKPRNARRKNIGEAANPLIKQSDSVAYEQALAAFNDVCSEREA